jgi:hypothetical protein
MRLRLQIQEKRLDDLFNYALRIQDDELKSHFSKYLCVRISGYFENVLKILIGNYVSISSSKPTSNFVQTKIRTLTNINDDRLSEILKSFSDKWCDDFNYSITDKHRESLNSLIANRNCIAHGQPDSISFTLVKQYYIDLKEIIANLTLIIRK